MRRITVADLDKAVDAVNLAAGTPLEAWSEVDGKLTPNAFNYHLSGAYGGYSLHQHGASGSGSRDVFQVGHVPKRELSGMLRAYRAGLEAGDASRYVEPALEYLRSAFPEIEFRYNDGRLD